MVEGILTASNTANTAVAIKVVRQVDEKGVTDEYRITNHSYSSARWGATDVALQQWMGLLSERRTRADCGDHHHSRLNGEIMSRAYGRILCGVNGMNIARDKRVKTHCIS